jgi:hypothetical protein
MLHEQQSANVAWANAHDRFHRSAESQPEALDTMARLLRAGGCVMPFEKDPEHLYTDGLREAHKDAKCMYILHSFLDKMHLAITSGPLTTSALTQYDLAAHILWADHANANLHYAFQGHTPLQRIRALRESYRSRCLHPTAPQEDDSSGEEDEDGDEEDDKDPFLHMLVHAQHVLSNILQHTDSLLHNVQALLCQYFHSSGCATCHGRHAIVHDPHMRCNALVHPMVHGPRASLIAHVAEAHTPPSVRIRFFVALHSSSQHSQALFDDTIVVSSLSQLAAYIDTHAFAYSAWNRAASADSPQ